MAGSASAGPNASSCTLCALGSISSSGAATCTECSGAFSPVIGGTACLPFSSCDANTQTLTAPGDSTHDNVCACNAGYYVLTPGNATTQPVCAPCTTGFTSAVNTSLSCQAHRVCAPGVEYQVSAGTSTSDTVCAAYRTCASGTYIAAQPANADRTCTLCDAGSYSTSADVMMCTLCAAGSASNVAGLTTVCPPCAAESYAPSAGATTCQPWQINCAIGQYVATDRSSTSDRVCLSCPDGTSTTAINQPLSGCVPPMMEPDAGM
jgi:hypothetical protein